MMVHFPAENPHREADGPVVVDDRNERARIAYPAEWARMETLTGKPRSRLRARLRKQADYAHGVSLLPVGARCGTCQHMSLAPLSKLTPSCDLDSDFHGYQTVQLSDSCPRWSLTPPAAPSSPGMEPMQSAECNTKDNGHE